METCRWPSKHQGSLVTKELTFYADDFRAVPLSIGATLSGGHVALQEAFGTLVADYGVDVVVGALPTNQEGVFHRRRGSTKHWNMKDSIWESERATKEFSNAHSCADPEWRHVSHIKRQRSVYTSWEGKSTENRSVLQQLCWCFVLSCLGVPGSL